MQSDRKLNMDELGRTDPASYIHQPKNRLRLVLDNVRSRHNVGSIFRTADAFALDGLELCGFTSAPPHREIEKTALGATRTVAWRHHARTIEAVEQLRAEGWQVWAVEQTVQAIPLPVWAPPVAGNGLALVLGNELNGVDEEVLARCDGAVVIPQQGTKHSLNISVAAGIVTAWAVLGGSRGASQATQGASLRKR